MSDIRSDLILLINSVCRKWPRDNIDEQHLQAKIADAVLEWQAAQAQGVEPWSIDDDVFADEFAQWWDEHGQFVKSGGGRYERYFAFEAWRYLYPLTLREQPAKPAVPKLPEGYNHLAHRRSDDTWMYLNHANTWQLCPPPNAQGMQSGWIEYIDSSVHPELKVGKKYCVKVGEGIECYAEFKVFAGGEEVGFFSLHTGKQLSVSEFRALSSQDRQDLQPAKPAVPAEALEKLDRVMSWLSTYRVDCRPGGADAWRSLVELSVLLAAPQPGDSE